jgi:hypothetical protein
MYIFQNLNLHFEYLHFKKERHENNFLPIAVISNPHGK